MISALSEGGQIPPDNPVKGRIALVVGHHARFIKETIVYINGDTGGRCASNAGITY